MLKFARLIIKPDTMGKGDKKTKRGKIVRGSFGVRRRKNKKTAGSSLNVKKENATTKKEDPVKTVEETTPDAVIEEKAKAEETEKKIKKEPVEAKKEPDVEEEKKDIDTKQEKIEAEEKTADKIKEE